MDFKIVHLSDLHFGIKQLPNGDDVSRHSEKHCQAIGKIISEKKNQLDLVIISGDISDSGDPYSLRDAKTWIRGNGFQTNGQPLSLGLDESNYHKLRIIPGNHDAYNYPKVKGESQMLHQKSLTNYNKIFAEDIVDEKPRFDWIENDEGALFIYYVDTSFLGDPDLEKKIPSLKKFDKLAKGKFSFEKSEILLEIFDKGVSGKLFNAIEGEYINKEKFKQSLKIIVMHHYLFEPPGFQAQPLLEISYKKSVFANIAMADFDILLCGHKHISSFNDHKYIQHFDNRAKARYLLNYFRRLIGNYSLPLQYKNDDGKKIGQLTSILITLGIRKRIQEDISNDILDINYDYLNKIATLLSEGISDPDKFDYHINRFILNDKSNNLDSRELHELAKKVRISLSDQEKKELKIACNTFKKVINNLSDRQFLQIMAGSSCKQREKKTNSFNIYEIKKITEGYKIHSNRYIWDEEKGNFSKPETKIHEFTRTNRPVH